MILNDAEGQRATINTRRAAETIARVNCVIDIFNIVDCKADLIAGTRLNHLHCVANTKWCRDDISTRNDHPADIQPAFIPC